jgi:hypothetical protein
MILGIITLLIALTISGVAIYYSVAGLVAIFAAAAIPIIIMGTALEVGKLVTAVWLHRYWKRASWWLRTYLGIAVFVLMLITSMGIFGFLSKAHVDQKLSSDTVTQRIDIVNNKIKAEQSYIQRQKDVLSRVAGQDKGNESRFNQDIQIEQKKIDDAYAQLKMLDESVKAYTNQGSGIFTDNVKKGLDVRESQQAERDKLNAQISQAQNNIDKLRGDINKTLSSNTTEIKTIEKNIFDAQSRIEQLVIEQEPLKSQIMKLESEVGPIRYIAEFVYGEKADANLLEEAVRWVIITIIFVFDPLAVLLLIASQYTFRWIYEDKYGALPTPPNSNPTPPTPNTPQSPTEGQSLKKLVEVQKDIQTKTGAKRLSTLAQKKNLPTSSSAEEQINFTIPQNETQHDEQTRRKSYEEKETTWQQAKQNWKDTHPGDTIHRWKDLYINGLIDKLPWEHDTVKQEIETPIPLEQWNKMIEEAEKEAEKETDPKKKTSVYIMRDKDQQVKKQTQAE